jgi:hypothetical protein
VTYLENLATGYGSVLYITQGDGEPITRSIETESPDAGAFLDIALDSTDGAWISYLGADSLVVTHVANGETHKFTVDDGAVGKHSSIAVDGHDRVHVAYQDHAEARLKYVVGSCSR